MSKLVKQKHPYCRMDSNAGVAEINARHNIEIVSVGRQKHLGRPYSPVSPAQRRSRVYLEGDEVCLINDTMSVAEAAAHRRTISHSRKVTIAVRDFLRDYTGDADLKIKWSRYAGCTMCPCSPGWIVYSSKLFDKVVWIKRYQIPEVDEE